MSSKAFARTVVVLFLDTLQAVISSLDSWSCLPLASRKSIRKLPLAWGGAATAALDEGFGTTAWNFGVVLERFAKEGGGAVARGGGRPPN